ncbi:MAG: M15 family metallopeptidase [Candidatus Gracilibacteria bacterium]
MTLVQYTSVEIKENNEPIVDASTLGFILEPKYFKQGLSADSRIFLRKEVAKKLLKIQSELPNLRFKIWDAYRSRDVQNNIYKKYWAELKAAHMDWDDEKLKLEVGKFVSPPYQKDRIPPHATGGAVDLTLIDENGNELDMGTEFDFFGPEAGSLFYEIDKDKPEVTKNRNILQEAMQAEGFTLDQDEWWHFDFGNQMWAFKSGEPFAFYGEVTDDFLV